MIRNLKLLIVFGAVAAMFAATAPAAFAWQFFHEEKGALGTELPDGTKKVAWTFSGGKAECIEKGEATEEATESSEDKFAGTSEECSGTEEPQEVRNGCEFDYMAGTVNFVGTVEIDCAANAKIEFKEKGCTFTVPGQKNLSSVSFSNLTGKGNGFEREITLEFKVTKLEYIEDNVAPGNTCKNPGVVQNNGTISGPKILTDENKTTKAMKGTWVA